MSNRIPKMNSALPAEIEASRAEIEEVCKNLGLDFFPILFEMLDYQQISEVAAYGGFPTRYPHWRFGMEYEQLSKSYEYGLSVIYEMVINNDPCYAYLLKSNPLVDQKTVIAHVYGHCDFFKNNYCFKPTNRKMLDEMGNHGARIRRYIEQIGFDEVENFLDVSLSLDNLIDLHAPHIRRKPSEIIQNPSQLSPQKLPFHRDYMDKYINPQQNPAHKPIPDQKDMVVRDKFPQQPMRDVLLFLLEHAPLNEWQKDALSIVREEAYYFAPQAQTKIMNEGWAVYWHSKLMTEYALKDSEVIDYCDHYAGVVAMSETRLNPYKLGVELFRHIEERWNKGRFGLDYLMCDDPALRKSWDTKQSKGRDKIFEVRKHYNDVTFLDEFLDEDFCEAAKLFTWAKDKRTGQYVLADRDFPAIKKELLDSLTNFGQPMIEVIDGNYHNRGELLLLHKHAGKDLKTDTAMETLKSLFKVWGRPVSIQTKIEDEPKLLTYDGTESVLSKMEVNIKE